VGDRAAQEADRRQGLLVGEDFDVDEPGRVVDADMDELPAELVGAPVVARAGDPTRDAVARPSDLAELLDVDVDDSPGRRFS